MSDRFPRAESMKPDSTFAIMSGGRTLTARIGRRSARFGLLVLLMTGAVSLWGQPFPAKPVRIVASEDDGSDPVVRILAARLSAGYRQPVLVDDPGGEIAGSIVAKADADGYTLLYLGGTRWILPLLRKDNPYDMRREFAPVTQATSASSILVAHPSLPVESVKDLIDLARFWPGKLNYASGASGTSNHLAAAFFVSAAGVNIVRKPHKETGSALDALLAGEAGVMFAAPGSAAPHIKSGKLRALGVTSVRRWPARPDWPTISEAGLPGYQSVTVTGFFAPARTLPARIARHNREIARALASPELKEVLADGVVAVGGPPERLSAAIKSEMARVGKLIRDAGIKDEQ